MNQIHPALIALITVAITLSILSCQHSSEDSHTENGHQGPMAEEQHQHNGRQLESSRPTTGNQALSPNRMAMANVGNTHVHIEYSAPSVRDRTVWGELVTYDQVWVTGAHMATSIEFQQDMVFEGEAVPAGKYALFTIPGRESWTVILNKNWDQHLTNEYDPELDLLRFEVTPESHEFTEQLTFTVSGNSEGVGSIEFAWEELKFHFTIAEK